MQVKLQAWVRPQDHQQTAIASAIGNSGILTGMLIKMKNKSKLK
jgi:hypothetical protein